MSGLRNSGARRRREPARNRRFPASSQRKPRNVRSVGAVRTAAEDRAGRGPARPAAPIDLALVGHLGCKQEFLRHLQGYRGGADRPLARTAVPEIAKERVEDAPTSRARRARKNSGLPPKESR